MGTNEILSLNKEIEKRKKTKIIKKYSKLVKILSDGLIGKEEAIETGLLTLLSGENMILIGPPGAAKSEIARRLTKAIKGGEYFEYLLTKFTTPEELFGPVSLTDLKNNVFKRQTEGYLPTAHIGFLDEIFKANSSILNSLLTIINEKVYHNGKTKEKSNIISIIGASNELPLNQQELAALYDRFLVKIVVNYLDNIKIRALYDIKDKEVNIPTELKFSIEEIYLLQTESSKINISNKVKRILINIRKDITKNFDNEEENISDRKFLKLLKIIRMSAYINNKKEVGLEDLDIISDCLWKNLENRDKIRDIIVKNLKI